MSQFFMFVGIDALAILLGILVASVFGETYGEEISPNILLLVSIFILIRSVLHWIMFKSIIRRSLDWTRSLVQATTLIISLSVVTFSLVSLSTYASSVGKAENIFLFFEQLPSSTFYYLVIPTVTIFISLVVHKFYKLEPW